jgi:hypothetical protein
MPEVEPSPYILMAYIQVCRAGRLENFTGH